MAADIVRRIVAASGIPDLLDILARKLAPADLTSLLLAVMRERAARRTLAELLAHAERNLIAPSLVDARTLHAIDAAAYAAAQQFEAMELSPVVPLGANAALGGTDQNNVLSTVRPAEVTPDPTVAQALECARRRRDREARKTAPPVRLCASQRLVRMQPVDVPGFSPHFRAFSLVTAGRAAPDDGFETTHLREHLAFYLRFFRALAPLGYAFTGVTVSVTDMGVTNALLDGAGVDRGELRKAVAAHKVGGAEKFLAARNLTLPSHVVDPTRELADVASQHQHLAPAITRLERVRTQVFAPLHDDFPDTSFHFDFARLEGASYYRGLCFHVSVGAPNGAHFPIADGGFTDWTQRLLADGKERLLTSGIGSELIAKLFRVSA